ncbi:MAG: phospholipase D family protein [Nitrososphaerota archaeon]
MKAKILLVMAVILLGFLMLGLSQQASRPATVTQTVSQRETVTTISSLTLATTVTETILRLETRTVSKTETETLFSTVTVSSNGDVRILSVCFSKPMNCASLLVSLINSANRSIYVAVYSFTRDDIADALIRAKLRGVDVRVVIEEENAGQLGSEFTRLRERGVEVRVDGNSRLMHHKIMIIDEVIVVTGSYNFSAAAEDGNDENIVVIRSREVAEQFLSEFYRVWRQSVA